MKNWVAEGIASDVNDFNMREVRGQKLKDKSKIRKCHTLRC